MTRRQQRKRTQRAMVRKVKWNTLVDHVVEFAQSISAFAAPIPPLPRRDAEGGTT